jgi:cytochrome P450 family 6
VPSSALFISQYTFSETLRKYQPNMNIVRVCTKNYIIPGTDVTLEVGTPVIIPCHTLSNDPKYFPEPERFDPERFSNDETSQKNKFAHLPFGEGPRQCIGE